MIEERWSPQWSIGGCGAHNGPLLTVRNPESSPIVETTSTITFNAFSKDFWARKHEPILPSLTSYFSIAISGHVKTVCKNVNIIAQMCSISGLRICVKFKKQLSALVPNRKLSADVASCYSYKWTRISVFRDHWKGQWIRIFWEFWVSWPNMIKIHSVRYPIYEILDCIWFNMYTYKLGN